MSALTQLIRKINAKRDAKRSAAMRCVVVVGTTTRERGRTDANTHVYKPADVCSCIHSVSYTMPCTKCKRTNADARREQKRVKALLSII